MYLNEISIKNFRNIKNENIKFLKNINIFIGKNAQGKTSILESIYFLAITKSHRTNIESCLIKTGESFSKVEGKIVNSLNEKNKLEIVINEKGKKALINGEKIVKLSKYISKLGVIIFSPNDLEILKGSPIIRRKNLNISISQINSGYLNCINIYNNILKQRNEYLKKEKNKIFDDIYFEILTNKIIEMNIKIMKCRYNFIIEINKNVSKIYKHLADKKNVEIKYETFVKNEQILDENLFSIVKSKFLKNKEAEIFQQKTLLGIHKDDFSFLFEDGEVNEYFSQGLQKIALLSFKLSELLAYEYIKKEKPIILLDDIFSELDNTKKNKILRYFDKNTQVFITTIDLKDINSKYFKDAQVYIVKNGKVKNAIKEET